MPFSDLKCVKRALIICDIEIFYANRGPRKQLQEVQQNVSDNRHYIFNHRALGKNTPTAQIL